MNIVHAGLASNELDQISLTQIVGGGASGPTPNYLRERNLLDRPVQTTGVIAN